MASFATALKHRCSRRRRHRGVDIQRDERREQLLPLSPVNDGGAICFFLLLYMPFVQDASASYLVRIYRSIEFSVRISRLGLHIFVVSPPSLTSL